MYPRVRLMAGWIVVALLLWASSSAAAAARDSAQLAPADSLLYVGWSGSDGDCQLLRLAQAVVASPLVQREAGEEIAVADKLFAFVDEIRRHTGAFVILPGGRGDDRSPVAAALIVAAGKEAVNLADALRAVVQALPHVGEVESISIDGTACSRLGAGPEPLRNLIWTVQGEHVVAAIGEPAARRALSHVKAGGQSLADSPELALARRKVKPAEQGWNFTVFGELGPFFELVRGLEKGAGPEAPDPATVLRALGLDAVKSFYLQFEPGEAGVRLSVFAHVAEGAGGIIRFWRQNPLNDADMAVIPRSAYWGQAWNLDLSGLWTEAMAVLEKLQPGARPQVDAALADASEFLGFSPVETLLPALGESWALYDAPEHGGLLFTGVVLVNEVRDEKVVHDCLSRLVKTLTPLAREADIDLKLRQATIDGQTVHYVLVGGLPIPVAPAWGFAEKRWVFGLFPQTVAVALKQADPRTRGPSLLDHPDFQRVRPLLPKELTAVGYVDSRYYQQLLYALAHLVRTAVASLSVGGEPSFDLASVPTFPQDLATVRSLVAGYGFDADGVLYTGYGSTPLTFLIGGGDTSVGTTALAISILLPSLARAREQAKRVVCAANLRGIGQGCHIYANDHEDKFPPELAELIKGGMAMRTMFVCPSSGVMEAEVSAILDGGPGRLRYTYIAKQTSASDSRNVLVYEDLANHNGEGGNVLFLDAHVEFLKPPALRKAVRDTYKRLKRESEIPAEFRD